MEDKPKVTRARRGTGHVHALYAFSPASQLSRSRPDAGDSVYW